MPQRRFREIPNEFLITGHWFYTASLTPSPYFRYMAITVVLHGALNDEDTLRTAVQFAAREKTTLRLVLGDGCRAEALEVELYSRLAEIRTKQGVPGPAFVIERADHHEPRPAQDRAREPRRWG